MPAHCPFCAPGIADSVFLEEGPFWAVYNIAPILPGHSLVVPRQHVASLLGLGDEEHAGLFRFARRVTRLLLLAFDAKAFDWSVQDGWAAGQTVAHLHLHIIPRRSGDLADPGDWYPVLMESNRAASIDERDRLRLSRPEIDAIVAKLRTLAQKFAAES